MPNFSITPFTASEAGAWSNSYLVSGRQDALLFDVVQLRNEAGKLADMIGRSGKTLKTVFISHAHPDHFLGSDVLADRFPEARFVTTPNVIGDLEKNGPWMLSLLQDRLGAEGPTRLVIPEAVTGNFVELEGSTFEIKEFGEGESAHIATLFVNEPKALLTADVVYNGAHLFLQEKHLESWLDRLDEFEAYAKKLGAAIYPGHGAPGGIELIDRTRGYLLDFAQAAKLGSPAMAQQRMLERYPDYRVKQFLTMFSIPAYFAPAVS
ncbi:MBL fold metallo-hydrolase [Bradyrhizobium sp.]|uniref:MBL fold metallo-hydrolase n=1 Tax=Bradyrhizobium sp. TaxID=376 RepID=UPI00260B545A|nr:MBL fold metallo-hydrolase [Bradyrhizobium sp.]